MSASSSVVTHAFPDFAAAAKGVLDFLQARLGFDLWMVTRTEGEDWIVLQTADRGYRVSAGAVFRWADSFCSRMVQGLGPRVAADSSAFPAYAAAPIARQVQIGSYVGVPIPRADGSLFGTLCAIHPTPQAADLSGELPLVELCADLLGRILADEIRIGEVERQTERVAAGAVRDDLTGLYSVSAWGDLLAAEECRCLQFGHPAYVAAVVSRAGTPDVMREVAQAVECAVRPADVVARVGPNELAVLGVESAAAEAERFEVKVRESLAAFRLAAEVAVVPRHPAKGLRVAWDAARSRAADPGG